MGCHTWFVTRKPATKAEITEAIQEQNRKNSQGIIDFDDYPQEVKDWILHLPKLWKKSKLKQLYKFVDMVEIWDDFASTIRWSLVRDKGKYYWETWDYTHDNFRVGWQYEYVKLNSLSQTMTFLKKRPWIQVHNPERIKEFWANGGKEIHFG